MPSSRTCQAAKPVLLVTGAAGGVGSVVARSLADEGNNIVLADVHQGRLDALAGKLNDGMEESAFAAVALDITDPASCDRAAAFAVERFGALDGLVNCAGVSRPQDSLTLSPSDWTEIIDVQLSGAFYIAQSSARIMSSRSGGKIVFISSTNAEAAFPRRASYCTAKAGVAMLVKVLAVEWAALGIRVNAVGPAYVETEMTKRNIEAGNVSRPDIERRIPLGRLAQPDDVAGAVAFLLSDRAQFITGQSLYVDGGWLAYGYL